MSETVVELLVSYFLIICEVIKILIFAIKILQKLINYTVDFCFDICLTYWKISFPEIINNYDLVDSNTKSHTTNSNTRQPVSKESCRPASPDLCQNVFSDTSQLVSLVSNPPITVSSNDFKNDSPYFVDRKEIVYNSDQSDPCNTFGRKEKFDKSLDFENGLHNMTYNPENNVGHGKETETENKNVNSNYNQNCHEGNTITCSSGAYTETILDVNEIEPKSTSPFVRMNLSNKIGYICTVLGKKYIITYLDGIPILVMVDVQEKFRDRVASAHLNVITNIIYSINGILFIDYVADGFQVAFDAAAIPCSTAYLAVLIWTGVKPYRVSMPFPNSYGYVGSHVNVPARILSNDRINLLIELQLPERFYRVSYPVKSFIVDNKSLSDNILNIITNKVSLLAYIAKFIYFSTETPSTLIFCAALKVPGFWSLNVTTFSPYKIYTVGNSSVEPQESSIHTLYSDVQFFITCEDEFLLLQGCVSQQNNVVAKLLRGINREIIPYFNDTKISFGNVYKVSMSNKWKWTLLVLYSQTVEWINYIQNVPLTEEVKVGPLSVNRIPVRSDTLAQESSFNQTKKDQLHDESAALSNELPADRKKIQADEGLKYNLVD